MPEDDQDAEAAFENDGADEDDPSGLSSDASFENEGADEDDPSGLPSDASLENEGADEEEQSGEDAQDPADFEEAGVDPDQEADDEYSADDEQGEGAEQGATLTDAETAASDYASLDPSESDPPESDAEKTDSENLDPAESDPAESDPSESDPAEQASEADVTGKESEADAAGKESENGKTGEGNNFYIKYSLTAGTTYYLGVRFYSSSNSGSVPVVIASCGTQGINSVSVSGGDTGYFSLTPSVSGSYVIFSGSSMDTYGYLYDSSWNQLASNDDSGYGFNFSISSYLSAGSTYYVGAKFYSSSNQGEIQVAAAPVCGGNQYNVYCSEGKTAYFAFTPSVTGDYEFYSKGSVDTFGYLYGPGLDLLTWDDDGGIGSNFHAEGSALQAGNTYLAGARFYQSSAYGQISVYARQYAGSCGSSLTWRLGYWKSDS